MTKQKSNKKFMLIAVIAVVVLGLVAVITVTGSSKGNEENYQNLVTSYELFEAKPNHDGYEEVATYLNQIEGDYKDVKQIKDKAHYTYGKYLAKLNRYDEAMTYLDNLSEDVISNEEYVTIKFTACNKKNQAGEADIDCINFLADNIDSEVVNAKETLLLAIYNALVNNGEGYIVEDNEALILDNGFESVADYYNQLSESKFKFKAKDAMFVNYQN